MRILSETLYTVNQPKSFIPPRFNQSGRQLKPNMNHKRRRIIIRNLVDSVRQAFWSEGTAAAYVRVKRMSLTQQTRLGIGTSVFN